MFEAGVEIISSQKYPDDDLLSSSTKLTYTWRSDPKFMPPNVFPHDENEYLGKSQGNVDSVIQVSNFILVFIRGMYSIHKVMQFRYF